MTTVIQVQPPEVGESSTLTIQITLQTPLADGDQISLPDNLSQSLFTLIAPTSGTTMTQNTSTMTFKQQSGTPTFLQLQTAKFQNPASVDQTQFKFSHLRNGKVIDTQTVKISNLRPSPMKDAYMKSIDSQIGSTTSELQFTMTIGSNLPQNGKIQLTVPIWNPNAPQDQQVGIFPGMPICTGLQAINTLIACDLNLNQLTLSGLQAQVKGTTLSFQVKQVRNPFNGKTLGGFILTTLTSDGNKIEQSQPLGFQVSTPAKFTRISLTPDNSIAGSLSTYRLSFQTDLPIDPNCRLIITAPTSFNIASTLKTVSGKTTFQSAKISMFDNVVTIDGCQSYFAQASDDVSLISIQNPAMVKDSDPFKVELFSVGGTQMFLIASETSLVVPAAFLQPGSFQSIKVTAAETTISEKTDIQISFKVQNPIPAINQLEIQFPTSQNFGFQDSLNCTLKSPLQNAVADPSSCTILGNKLTLKNFSSGPIAAGAIIGFGLQNMRNAISSADAGTFTLRSFVTQQGVNYLIDQTSVAGLYQSTAGSASFNSLPTSSSYITSDRYVTYTISFKLRHTVPKNGRVKVTLPTTNVTIDNVQAIMQGSRVSLGGLNSTRLATMISCIQSTGEIVLGGIFDSDLIPDSLTGTPIWIQIPGLTNPRSTQPTQSILVETQDQNGYSIDKLSDGLVIQMKTPGQLAQLTIAPQLQVNAAVTSYAITVESDGPMRNGDYLQLQFPQEIILPGTLTCTPGSNLKSVTCVRNGGLVDFTFQFQNGGIRSPQNFTVNIANIQNPSSTKMTSPFTKIMTYDSQKYLLSTFDKTPVTIQTTVPAQIFQSSIGSSTIVPNQNVTYTLMLTTVTSIPENAAIVVQYPSGLQAYSSMSACQMTVSGSTYKRTCTLDKSNRTIKMTKGLPIGVPGGTQISLVLGVFVSPQNTEDQSMIVTTYADPDGQYMVDQALQNMIPGVQCKSPCKGCASELMPTQCTQCYTDGGKYPFLFVNRGFSTCMSNCPDGNYADYAYQCQQCYSSCMTCSKFPECSSCNRQSGYPFFYKNTCIAKCPAGTYGDSDGLCVECQSPCLTCSGPQNGQCNSCAQTTGLNYLQGSTCVSTCQAGTVPLDRVCKPCTDGCATCSTSQSQCLSCVSGLFKLGTACVSDCTDGYFNDELSGQCLGCDPKCKVCQGNDPAKMVCSECNFGFNLFNGTCLIGCPEGTLVNNQTFHCDVKVPTIFDDYLMCSDVGQNVNSQMVLYFPITITLLIVIGLCVGSHYFYNQTQIYELIIAMASPLEIISLFETCRQAFLVEGGGGFQCISDAKTEQLRTIYPVISYVTLGVLLIGYGLNAYSILSIMKNVKLNSDADFVAWRDHNKKSSYYMVLAVQTAFSFKFCWLWVSSFLNQKRYNANLGDGSSRKIYNKQMTHLGIAHMVCVNAPVFVIAVSGLVTYRWGAQIVISLIDNLIVTLLMVGVQVYLLVTLSKKKYDTSMHKTAVLLGGEVSDLDTNREGENEVDDSIEILVGENGEKFIKGEDGERIFIADNGVRFIIEESGERVEFGAGGEKIYTEADGSKTMKTADGTKIFIAEDGKLLVLDENGEKVEILKDSSIVQSIPKSKIASQAVALQRSIDEMIQELDYDESKIGEDVDNQFGTVDNTPPSMTYGYYDFNAHDIIGNIEYRGFEPGSKIDRNGLRINKGGFLIDTVGNIIDREHGKVLDKFYLRQTQESFPWMYNLQGVKFNIKDICGKLIKDETNGRAVLKQHIETQIFWDRQARMVNNRGYLIDKNGNVINKQGRTIFEACHLSEEGEIPKIFKFTKFDRSLILGKFQCKSNGKPKLKKDISLPVTFKRDEDGKIVNELGYLCDLKGNIVDVNGKKIFDRCVLQYNTEIPAFFLEEGRLIKKANVDYQSPVNSSITLFRQESIVEAVEEEEKSSQVTSMLNSSQNNTKFTDLDSDHPPSKFKKLNLAFDRVEEESGNEDSVTTEEVQEAPKNLFLENLRALHHGHAFGYIGEAMVASQKYTEIPNQRILTIMQQISKYFKTKIQTGVQKIQSSSSRSSSRFSPNRRDNRTEPGSKMELTNLGESSPRTNKTGSRTMQVSSRLRLPKAVADQDKAFQKAPRFSTEPSQLEVRKIEPKQPELAVKDSVATFGSFDNLDQAILPKFYDSQPSQPDCQQPSKEQGEVVLTDEAKHNEIEFSSVRHKERQSPRTNHADRKLGNPIVRKDTNLTEKQEKRSNFLNSPTKLGTEANKSPTKPGTVAHKARKHQSKIMTADQQIDSAEVEKQEKTSEESDGSLHQSQITKSPKKVFKKVNDKRLKRLEGSYCATTLQPKPSPRKRKIETAGAKTIDNKDFTEESRKQAEQLLSTNYWNQEIAWVAKDLDGALSEKNDSAIKNSPRSDHNDNQTNGGKEVDSVVFTSYQKD